MPSSTAARVALSASSTRSFLSFTSTSVAPPTRITATPPASLARRSWSFSRLNAHALGATEHLERYIFQLDAKVFGNQLTGSKDRNILEHCPAAGSQTRRPSPRHPPTPR